MIKGWTVLVLLGVFLLGTSIPASLAGEAGKYSTVVLKEFSLEGTSIQENEDVKAFAQALPPDFSIMVKEFLQAMKVSQDVVEENAGKEAAPGSNAIIVEGRFTKISAGSAAKRFFVGEFGAGASGIGAEWTIKDATTGKVLGKYDRNQRTRSAVPGVVALESDARHLAKYVASSIQKLLK